MTLRSCIHKNYFLVGTSVGLVLAWLLANALLGGTYLAKMLTFHDKNEFGFIPILAGALFPLPLAFLLDKKINAHRYLISGLFLPIFIFFSGTVFGGLVNFALNGHLVDFYSWFFKPLFLICYLGIPSAFLVGTFYFLLIHKLKF